MKLEKLRDEMTKRKKRLGWNVFLPKFEFTTDNAGMIAMAGYYKYLSKDFVDQSIAPYSRSGQK